MWEEVDDRIHAFFNWDTHENGHTRLVSMKKQIEHAMAQLVLDLEARGLLNRTLIVLASEFSRDAMIEGKPDKLIKDQVEVPANIEAKHYGMHRHFTDAGCVLLLWRRHEARASPRPDRRQSRPYRRSRTGSSSRICTPRFIARSAFRRSSPTKLRSAPSTSATARANRYLTFLRESAKLLAIR